jgi:hypothetical protein
VCDSRVLLGCVRVVAANDERFVNWAVNVARVVWRCMSACMGMYRDASAPCSHLGSLGSGASR